MKMFEIVPNQKYKKLAEQHFGEKFCELFLEVKGIILKLIVNLRIQILNHNTSDTN